MIHNYSASWGMWKAYRPINHENGTTTSNPAFYVDLTVGQVPGYPPGAEREAAVLTTGLAGWRNNQGDYNQTTCYLHAAIVEYDVVIEDDIIKFDGDSIQGRVVRLANNTPPATASYADMNTKQTTTLDGFTEYLSIFVNANGSVSLTSSGAKDLFTAQTR